MGIFSLVLLNLLEASSTDSIFYDQALKDYVFNSKRISAKRLLLCPSSFQNLIDWFFEIFEATLGGGGGGEEEVNALS